MKSLVLFLLLLPAFSWAESPSSSTDGATESVSADSTTTIQHQTESTTVSEDTTTRSSIPTSTSSVISATGSTAHMPSSTTDDVTKTIVTGTTVSASANGTTIDHTTASTVSEPQSDETDSTNHNSDPTSTLSSQSTPIHNHTESTTVSQLPLNGTHSSTHIPISTTTLARKCVFDQGQCVFEKTEDVCDPCEGKTCDKDRVCKANTDCSTYCDCANSLQHLLNNTCVNVCLPNPCQNGKECVPDKNSTHHFYCKCSTDYEGELCETVHDYCGEAQPALCPKGPRRSRRCDMHGVGNYTCQCAEGYIEKMGECTKIDLQLQTILKFQLEYNEKYNENNTQEYITTTTQIRKAMEELYRELLIDLNFGRFTQGSVDAHLMMNLKTNSSNGDANTAVNNLETFIVECANGHPATMACFGNLPPPALVPNSTLVEDLRCKYEKCPLSTHCEPIGSGRTGCYCDTGYDVVSTFEDESRRIVQTCKSIDFCNATKPVCDEDHVCEDTPGSYYCWPSPCASSPCMGYAECTAIDLHVFTCTCEWIYLASDCSTPWPLILVILASLFLFLLILAVAALIYLLVTRRRRSSTDRAGDDQPVDGWQTDKQTNKAGDGDEDSAVTSF